MPVSAEMGLSSRSFLPHEGQMSPAHFDPHDVSTALDMSFSSLLRIEPYETTKPSEHLALVAQLPIETVPSSLLFERYAQAVSSIDPRLHKSSAMEWMLDAGKLVAPYFPSGSSTHETIRELWEHIIEQATPDEQYALVAKKDELLALVPYDPATLAASVDETEDHFFHRREKQDLRQGEKDLLMLWKETTQRERGGKLLVWDKTPEFRRLAAVYKISLERFWNLSDPDTVAEQFTQAKQDPDMAALLGRYLPQTTGLTLDIITDSQVKVLADQVVDAARSAIHQKSHRSFADVQSAFGDMVTKAKTLQPQSQRQLLRPITRFLEEHGVSVPETSVETIEHLLADPAAQDMVRISYTSSQEKQQATVQKIAATFGIVDSEPTYRLSARTSDDLTLGDICADCTAQHMAMGHDFWTVPVWLANPGFTFFTIHKDNRVAAKFGLVLAAENGKPGLVIDSVEINAQMYHDAQTREMVLDGLAYVRQWAKSIGLGDTFVNDISNNKQVEAALKTFPEKRTTQVVSVLGGIGATEFQQNLPSICPEPISMHLQSFADTTRSNDQSMVLDSTHLRILP